MANRRGRDNASRKQDRDRALDTPSQSLRQTMTSLDGNFLAALRALVTALDDVPAPSMIIGGIAAIAHGVLRSTLDIDAAVWAEHVDLNDLVHRLKKQGNCGSHARRSCFPTSDRAWHSITRTASARSESAPLRASLRVSRRRCVRSVQLTPPAHNKLRACRGLRRVAIASLYSSLSATIGSSRAARRVGR